MRGAVLFVLGTSIRATLDHKTDCSNSIWPYTTNTRDMTSGLEAIIIVAAIIAVCATIGIVFGYRCRR